MTQLAAHRMNSWIEGPSREKCIRSCLIESVDATFQKVFGIHAAYALYSNFELNGLSRCEIPDKMDAFCSSVEDACGSHGGLVIQRLIAERFYAKLGLTFVPHSDRKLRDYVNESRMYVS
ncbi:MAG: hypothetical protein ACLPY5_16665 [Candidatus Bathyarchaeia archaeon]